MAKTLPIPIDVQNLDAVKEHIKAVETERDAYKEALQTYAREGVHTKMIAREVLAEYAAK